MIDLKQREIDHIDRITFNVEIDEEHTLAWMIMFIKEFYEQSIYFGNISVMQDGSPPIITLGRALYDHTLGLWSDIPEEVLQSKVVRAHAIKEMSKVDFTIYV